MEKNIDLDLLKRFYIVAQNKSITKAAKKLKMTQPALSRSLKSLENSAGESLFLRTSTGMELNQKGQQLLEYTKGVLNDLAQFEQIFFDDENTISGDLKIITFPFIGSEILVPALHNFIKTHPDIHIQIHVDPENITPIGYDIGIGSFIPNAPDFVQKELFSAHTKLFASTAYLEKYGTPRTADELVHHRIISYKNADYQSPYRSSTLIFDICENLKKPEIKPHFAVDSLHGVMNAALNGYGICELVNYPHIMTLPLNEVLPEYKGKETPVYFIYDKNRSYSRKIQTTYDYLQEFFISI